MDNKDVGLGEINGREGCMVANPKPRWAIGMAKGLAPRIRAVGVKWLPHTTVAR